LSRFNVLLVTSALAWVGAFQMPLRSAPAAEPPAGYVGSASCQRCHDDEYATWRKTLHVQMTKPIR